MDGPVTVSPTDCEIAPEISNIATKRKIPPLPPTLHNAIDRRRYSRPTRFSATEMIPLALSRKKLDNLSMLRWVSGIALAICCTGLAPAVAQSTQTEELAPGKFLVASRRLPDPNFSRTVVLLVQYDKKGAMGLIINRRTEVPLSRVFDELKDAKDRTDAIYVGGPVERSAVMALIRSSGALADAKHVFADIYMLASRSLLEKTLAAHTGASAFHAYLGYAGWGPSQLDGEVKLGSWFIFRGDAAMVFDPAPDSVWSRLIGKTELRIASAK
jgi:putative transcriptional regulator